MEDGGKDLHTRQGLVRMTAMDTIVRMTDRERAKAQLLVDAGIRNLRDLSRIAEVSEATVNRYWHDRMPEDQPNYVVLVRMARALGITVDALYERLARADNRYFPLTPSDLYAELLAITEPDRHQPFRALVPSMAAS